MRPKVSILIPTLNAANVLEDCLKSIISQDYPKESIEIIVADGGSTDNTVEIAKKYNAKIISNPLRTGESGKMAALKVADGKYIALIDSDNQLPNQNWLNEVIDPLEAHPEAVGSEPWMYTWRPTDGFITRYCALMGLNDPLVYFLGNYDRLCLLSGTWTRVPHEEIDKGNYLLTSFDKRGIPTIGANGTVFRMVFLNESISGDYLFDIDILASFIDKQGSVNFIKVKNGIIHSFCGTDISQFTRKQKRRIHDYLFHKSQNNRSYNWQKGSTKGLIFFVLSTITVFPLILQSAKGYIKKPDFAWFFHIPACFITLWQYSFGALASLISPHEMDRKNWHQ